MVKRGDFWCPICQKNHMYNSKIGKEHLFKDIKPVIQRDAHEFNPNLGEEHDDISEGDWMRDLVNTNMEYKVVRDYCDDVMGPTVELEEYPSGEIIFVPSDELFKHFEKIKDKK